MDGQIVEGIIDAVDEKTAISRLKDSGIIPLKVSLPKKELKRRFTIGSSKADLLTFTTELSSLLAAGLPLDRSLNIISGISESSHMNNIITSVLKSIRGGSSFSDALRKHPNVFPNLYVNMIKAGESGGVLDVVLEKLNEFLESAKELKDHVISAMIYPAILFVTGIASIIVLLGYVIPKFSTVFTELGATMPLPTRMLITISSAIASFWWLIVLAIIAGWLLSRNYIKTDNGKYAWDAFKLKFFGELITKLETARFTRTLGTLLKSGVPLLQALENAKDIINNRVIASTIYSVSKDAKEGKGIAAPLYSANAFPPLALSMIKVGEETGQLDTMLLKVAATYEKSLRVSLKRFLSLLEPALILMMALIIGFIVISMLMAIFSITDIAL
jgi:general secretion pathway protein F